MVVGEVAEMAELLVIGGGPGGYAAAIHAARLGRQVTLIEREAVGGTCLNVGCIPSKALIEVADLAWRAGHGEALGVHATVEIDMARVHDHLGTVVDGLVKGVDGLLRGAGVTVVRGAATFVRPDRVVVDEGEHVQHVEFDQVLVATGSRPTFPPGLEPDGSHVLDSTGALALERLPASVVVVGGGYIGVELGTALAKLGSRVTLVELADRLLPGLEPALGKVVGRRLKELGVAVRLGTAVDEVTTEGVVAGGTPVEGEVVVVATGRRPNTDGFGLERTGAEVGPGGLVEVDAARRAGPRVLAIGDITPGPALAHKAMAEAEVAARTAAGQVAAFDPAAVPQVVFGDPELVSVGLTSDEAKAAGAEVRAFSFPLSASGRARTLGSPLGFAQVVCDGPGTVLGVHLAGPHVSELAGEAALAVELAATAEELRATIHAHPTIGEALAEAAAGVDGAALHVAPPRRRG